MTSHVLIFSTFDANQTLASVIIFIALPEKTKMMNGSSKTSDRPSAFRVWLTATRPHTLTASICPCLVAYAANHGALLQQRHFLLVAWVVFCVTIQIGTNLHNDYSDYVQGADTDKRVGQARATAQGWLTPYQTCAASVTVLSITFLAGCYLAMVTEQLGNGWLWFLILSSIFNAFAYTGGPFPLGYVGLGNWSIAYAGLGDIFVFLYFGLVATLMIPYLLSLQDDHNDIIDWTAQWLYAVQVGLLATNIIVVNNLRDRHTDLSAGKHTTAVRFGKRFSLTEYGICLVGAFSLVLVDALRHRSFPRLLPLLAMPLGFKEFKSISSLEGSALNQHVGGAAKVQTAFCILLSAVTLFTGNARGGE